MTETATPHGFTTRTLHWVSAGLVAYGYTKGLEDITQLADPDLFWFEVRFAAFLGAVFAIRLLWTKKVAGSTRLPDTAPAWERWASQAVHLGLYGAVFGIVLTGLAIAWGYTVPMLSGTFVTGMIALHEAALAALPVLLGAHVAGALWHKVVRRDGILESMTGRLPF